VPIELNIALLYLFEEGRRQIAQLLRIHLSPFARQLHGL
jgi:hypothetical protein